MSKNSVISRQTVFLLTFSALLFISIIMFALLVLLPGGKNYRIKRTVALKHGVELRQLETFEKEIEEKLQNIKSDNRHVMEAISNKFDKKRFITKYKTYFQSLKLSEKKAIDSQDGFKVYDVNTISSINSPKHFYNFLEAVNKSDWIIKINFPITFKRDRKIIESSFSMRVYYTK